MKFKILNAGFNVGTYERPFHDYLGAEIQTYHKIPFINKYIKGSTLIIKLIFNDTGKYNCIEKSLQYLANKNKEEIMKDIIDRVRAEYSISDADMIRTNEINKINNSLKDLIGTEFEFEL